MIKHLALILRQRGALGAFKRIFVGKGYLSFKKLPWQADGRRAWWEQRQQQGTFGAVAIVHRRDGAAQRVREREEEEEEEQRLPETRNEQGCRGVAGVNKGEGSQAGSRSHSGGERGRARSDLGV